MIEINMNLNQIQFELDQLKTNTGKKLEDYNYLLRQCAQLNEMGATVYIYDIMREKNILPDKETYSIIDKLHSKTITENISLRIPKELGKRTLAPRRRIHKIMKGYNYHDQHTEALKYVGKVKGFLEIHPEYKNSTNRFFLAETIHNHCNIPIKICRIIITHLKKTKYLVSNPKICKKVSLDTSKVFEFGIDKNPYSQEKTKGLYRQQTIGEFFK